MLKALIMLVAVQSMDDSCEPKRDGGNAVTVTQSNGGVAQITQGGSGNRVTVVQSGSDRASPAHVAVRQTGDANRIDVTQSGADGSGSLEQVGDSNTIAVSSDGALEIVQNGVGNVVRSSPSPSVSTKPAGE